MLSITNPQNHVKLHEFHFELFTIPNQKRRGYSIQLASSENNLKVRGVGDKANRREGAGGSGGREEGKKEGRLRG